mmetsp:Transcript_52109/g.82718  ORF Transcript_52109/g.82718 Transcript_52109/m.82718 type:complete len:221 (+) Transcript_52109:70-732(+)|eukprot:CAMPEP_0169131484 /NCGR_PEP_ID=MMETSP1015-20121227/38272_1 /TAXON_ID=342587 /ORGANISM="Karlodinium micrum, Strain CCMP2283" /LENGTH=220 /DNA_ID=CAMNT_0009195749 /DNA_START=70 /DNA_END=732 /DNA_ORIENTATION=-
MGGGKSKEEQVKEKAKEWQRQIRSECRRLDRDINKIKQEEGKLKKEIEAMAKKGQKDSVITLTKQVVRSRNSARRLERTKVSLNSVSLHLTNSIATMSTATSLKMSAGVMREMNRLMNVPEIAQTMQAMQKEMAKAEIVDEMMEEAFADEDDEGEVDKEVEKVFAEIGLDTAKLFGDMTTADLGPVNKEAAPKAQAQPTALASGGEAEDPLMARLRDLQK